MAVRRDKPKYVSFCRSIISALVVILLFSPSVVYSEENYVFERMWPTLHQPWYFQNVVDIIVDMDGYVYLTEQDGGRIRKFTRDGRLITSIGKPFNQDLAIPIQDGELSRPQGAAIDGEGNVYIIEDFSNRVQKFDKEGKFIASWNTLFSGNTPRYRGIAIDDEGDIFLCDQANDKVEKYSPSGELLDEWGSSGSGDGQFSDPRKIAIDRDGNIYVYDASNWRIQKFSPDGNFITKWGNQGTDGGEFSFSFTGDAENWRYGISFDKFGFVYVSDGKRIQKFSPDGAFISIVVVNDDPVWELGTLALYDDELYIYRKGVRKYRITGEWVEEWKSFGSEDGQFLAPRGIASDSQGNVFVVDRTSIKKFSPDGSFIMNLNSSEDSSLAVEFPWDIDIDSQDNLYVVDHSGNKIVKFDASGGYVMQWGVNGSEDGQFYYPRYIAIDQDDNIYVGDSFNYRIQVFSKEGQFIRKFGQQGYAEGQFYKVFGLDVDSSGNVYVVEGFHMIGFDPVEGPNTVGPRIQVFDSAGVFLRSWDFSGNNAYDIGYDVAVTDEGNILVSSDEHIQAFTNQGTFLKFIALTGSYPGQVYQPKHMHFGINNKLYITELGHYRAQILRKTNILSNNKAIIVSGGGPINNHIWESTQANANFAYRSLVFQGFTKESIKYLSSNTDMDLDSNGIADDVDADATNHDLQQVLASPWALEAENLVIYLVDHGGDANFKMSSNETLGASQLDAWIDELQSQSSCKVIVVYEACKSGSFISLLSPPVGSDRFVVTSTSPGEDAHFSTQGAISFSSYFWTHIFNGLDIKDAFVLTTDALGVTYPNQNPLMDTDGDGVDNSQDGYESAQGVYIGNGTHIVGQAPEINAVSEEQIISEGNTALLYADGVNDDDGIGRVWAVIRPPNYTQDPTGNPVLGLPTVNLIGVDGETDRFEVHYSGFNIKGTYHVAIYAMDNLGNTCVPSLTTVSVDNPLRQRAVIVAGGSQSNAMWPAIEKNTTLAYDALRFQGYKDDFQGSNEDIFFLSPETFSVGVDTAPSLSNLKNVLESFTGQDTGDVVLYLIGPNQNGAFQITPTELLSGAALDEWLDALQDRIPGRITVIYDSPLSANFISQLLPPTDKQRTIITSCSKTQSALYLSDGDISFSKFFWRQVLWGANVREAFLIGKKVISFITRDLPRGRITAQLDDNGNGISNEKVDGLETRYYTLGAGILLAGDEPVIGSVSGPVLLNGAASAEIWAKDITATGTLERVWAVIRPPNSSLTIQNPIINFPEVDLVWNDSTHRFEGVSDEFSLFGAYEVAVFAKDTGDNISMPVTTYVQQMVGADVYEQDDDYNSAGVLILNATETRTHTFHDIGNEDWVKFYGIAGQSYEIETNNLGTICDTVITLYDSTGTNEILKVDDGWHGEREFTSWACQANGIYYIKVTQANPNDWGTDTSYDLSVYRPIAPVSAWFVGTVTNAITGAPVDNAIVQTSGLGSAISQPDSGSYNMIHDVGTNLELLTVVADGYLAFSDSLSVTEEGTITLNIEMIPEDLTLAVTALKIISGMEAVPGSEHVPDANNDGKVGMEDVIYIMQNLSGLRQ